MARKIPASEAPRFAATLMVTAPLAGGAAGAAALLGALADGAAPAPGAGACEGPHATSTTSASISSETARIANLLRTPRAPAVATSGWPGQPAGAPSGAAVQLGGVLDEQLIQQFSGQLRTAA